MRIAAVSDLHAAWWMINYYPPADVFVFAGDFSNIGHPRELYDFSLWIKQLPYEKKIIVAGNHDRVCEEFCTLDITLYFKKVGAIYLYESGVEIDGVKFWGSPWTPQFFDWSFMGGPEEMEKRWALIPDDTDVLITHGPPYGILDQSNVRAGCSELRERLEIVKPRIHIFGHIHEARGMEVAPWGTYCYNVAFNYRNPQITVIELET